MADPVAPERPVPWRTIWAVIGSVAVTYLGYRLAIELKRILLYLVVALFFAVVLGPAVDWLEQRARVRRWLSVLLVMLVGLGLVVAMLYAFIRPLAHEASSFSKDLPHYVADARHGKGPVGDLIRRYKVEDYVKKNQDRLQKSVTSLGAPALHVARSVFNGAIAGVTVFVLTVLMLIQGPSLVDNTLRLVPERRREQVRRVSADSSKAVAGYVAGNLLISLIAGVATWTALQILGVPFAAVLGLFVAFADLIPLVGATLGAIPTIGFAALHSITAGVVMLIFYIIYQQFENHVLQVSIMSKTVRVSPLMVLVSVLVGVELLGFMGALLAIPAAGVLQVITRDVYDERMGRVKDPPTEGEAEKPIAKKRSPAKKAAPKKAAPKKAAR
jgi:predicted PurR-regulated permease PerM